MSSCDSCSIGAADQLTSVTDANNHTTTYAYDGAGRSWQRIEPLSHTWATTYWDSGQVLATTDPNGVATTNTNDGYGRLTGIAYSDDKPRRPPTPVLSECGRC